MFLDRSITTRNSLPDNGSTQIYRLSFFVFFLSIETKQNLPNYIMEKPVLYEIMAHMHLQRTYSYKLISIQYSHSTIHISIDHFLF